MTAMAVRNERVLIIDDDAATTQTFAVILRLEGYQVRTAITANDGLREVSEFNPDAIIVDLRMPLINGFGFLYRLRKQYVGNNTPVAIVTGDVSLDDDALDELRELGADICFKPLWTDDLVGLADKLLSH
ncbi:MAG TPA: response regulator [Vicinamibacterales bacterium]|nr:response regulator [Vicinamibacterales bacterium]